MRKGPLGLCMPRKKTRSVRVLSGWAGRGGGAVDGWMCGQGGWEGGIGWVPLRVLMLPCPLYAQRPWVQVLCLTPPHPFPLCQGAQPAAASVLTPPTFCSSVPAHLPCPWQPCPQVLHLSRLTSDYLDVEGDYYRATVGKSREAPALFKHQVTNWLAGSVAGVPRAQWAQACSGSRV